MNSYEIAMKYLSPMIVRARSMRSAVTKCFKDPDSAIILDCGDGRYGIFYPSKGGETIHYIGTIRRVEQ